MIPPRFNPPPESAAVSTPRWMRSWWIPPPPEKQIRSIAIIVATLAAIGWLDYVVGFWVSLQVFYLIPTLMSVAWIGWRAGCATAVLSVVVRVLGDGAAGIFQHVDAIAVFWNRLAESLVYVTLVSVLHGLLSLQRELEIRVRQRTASLEQAVAARDDLQKQLFEVSRRERSAIGHDLHDGLGQHLTATSIAANVLATRLAGQSHPDAGSARHVVDLVQEGIAKTRQIARGLLLSAIEPAELGAELEELATRVRQEYGITCELLIRGTVNRINLPVASHLFYIAQEAALNGVRHAAPSRIEITLSNDAHELTLSISDNGRGLPPLDPDRPGMGLRIMQHRSELIGAEFSIRPVVPHGTSVHCRLPLSNSPVAAT